MANIQPIGLNLTQINYFSKKIWKQMRTQSIMDQLASESGDSAVHRVTELQDTTWGKKAILTLIPDDTSFGVVGDNPLENREVGITAHNIEITFDQFRKAYRNVGRMDDRTYFFKFAQQVADQLSYWAADIKDRMFMNTIAGVGYEYEVNGARRDASCEWNRNAFAQYVSPPTPNRHFRWSVNTSTGAGRLEPGNTAAVAATDIPSWNMFIDMRTELPLMRIKPIRGKWGNGSDLYICIVHPRTMNAIKRDPVFQQNMRDAMQRGEKNPLFTGAETYLVDGILLISHRYAYTTLAAPAGSKWGAGGTVDGARSIFLGAQAVGLVEMQAPRLVTEEFDYKNSQGIAMDVQFGMRAIKWPDQYANNSNEWFGICVVDHAVTPGPTNYTI